MIISLWMIFFFVSIGILAYHRATLAVWSISFLVLLLLLTRFSALSAFILGIIWIIFAVCVLMLNNLSLRRHFITQWILKKYRDLIPKMSTTEREALEAGTVTWEGDLFQGIPDWQKLFKLPAGKLTAEEQAFLEGPVAEVCSMTDDWDVTHNRADLPPQVWQFLKDQGFFGIIIPKQYGGKQFSALAHSAILVKLYAKSVTLATTVGVPNSLGPAELLLHYGTQAQKNYYLPRLARGEEIPCFALTNPEAGSDAGSIPDFGIVCKEMFDGKETLGIRLNWNKRYITLAPVATVLGLAFKLYDPSHLIGKQEKLGITCALIPVNTPGISIGRRHFPLHTVFQNGPTQGKDVFIPLDWIIGGVKMAGQGWRMLVECLSAGRAISLPSSAVASTKMMSFVCGAYAHIRQQFNVSIGKFEGIQQPLARIAATTYLIDASVKFTLAAIDRGEKPAIPSAIMKYHATESARLAALDAMDIHGGKGICLGPNNYLSPAYVTAPIGITVEGANILTRNLIIFGQGAVRCHPYALAEMQAAQDEDEQRGIEKFDQALFSHLGYSISNFVKTLVLSITNGYFVNVNEVSVPNNIKNYLKVLSRYSAAFAMVADISMLSLGGDLKRKENLSARLGDILSLLYMSSAVLKNYADENCPEDSRPLIQWIIRDAVFNIQQQFDSFFANFPQKILAWVMRAVVFPVGRHVRKPSDRLSKQVAQLILSPTPTREELTMGLFTAAVAHNPIGLLQDALIKVIAAEPLEKQLSKLLQQHNILGVSRHDQLLQLKKLNLLTTEEMQILIDADTARAAIIAVDNFAPEELVRK